MERETHSTVPGARLILTVRAVERLQALLEESGETQCRLRIRIEGPDDDPTHVFSFEEGVEDGDIVLDYVHLTVLLDEWTCHRLSGHEVDYRYDQNGECFIVRRIT